MKIRMMFVIALCLLFIGALSAETSAQDDLQGILERQNELIFDCEIRYEDEVTYSFDNEIFVVEEFEPGSRVVGVVFSHDAVGRIDIWHWQEQKIGPGGILQMTLPLQQLGEQQVAFLKVQGDVCVGCRVYPCYRYSAQIQEKLLNYHLNIYELLENQS